LLAVYFALIREASANLIDLLTWLDTCLHREAIITDRRISRS